MKDLLLGKKLQRIREEARISQSDLARKLPFTASRISRLESGELNLDAEEAANMATAIGSEKGKAFASFLSWEWSRLKEVPAFEHPNLVDLWKAEQALQKLDNLKNDPELKNIFLKQVKLCEEELLRAAEFLQSTEHSVAFVGSPGVGKTTAICALIDDLRDQNEKDLNRQMALQTGSGRTTICEVHVRRGGEYAITIEPCSDEELRYHISDFCDFLLSLVKDDSSTKQNEGSGISAEMGRTLRNMTGLTIKKQKLPNGKIKRDDPAIDLVGRYPKKEELLIEVLARYNILKRRRTSIAYPSASSILTMKWLSKTFGEINFGRHPEFSLPRRIEVSVPNDVLASRDLTVRLIDTRGVDEPSVPRRDLQSYLDDERTIVVFCSRFEDAPSAAVQALIERGISGGLQKAILDRGKLLILPKENEEAAVLSDITGEPVGDPDEGREIRQDQVKTTTLTDLGVRDLPVEFVNVRCNQDCTRFCSSILDAILSLRQRMTNQVGTLVQTVEYLIKNKADEQIRVIFEQVTKRLQTWLSTNSIITGKIHRADEALLEEMESLRYASSLRASVSRRGNWHNFDYWHGLGFGVRRDAVIRSKEQVTKLKGIIENLLNDNDLQDAHDFIRQFLNRLDETSTTFFVDVQQLGETIFSDSLRGDHDYWKECQNRWGLGSGYKSDIRGRTYNWFSNDFRNTTHDFLEAEIQRLWGQLIDCLSNYLEDQTPEGDN